jgi:hypothetical protein
MGDPPNYEPDPADQIQNQAALRNLTPHEYPTGHGLRRRCHAGRAGLQRIFSILDGSQYPLRCIDPCDALT